MSIRQEQTDITLAGLSGALASQMLGISGTLNSKIDSVSGTLQTSIYSTSGTLQTSIFTTSGTLNTKIDNTSGTLTSYINAQIASVSGYAGTVSGYIAADQALSGTLNNTINNVSGALYAQIVVGGGTGSNYATAILTGLGANFNDTWYTLSLANLGDNHPVNGISGIAITPSGGPIDQTLIINGLVYHLDYYIDALAVTQPGVFGTVSSSGGFSLDLTGPKIRWNYTNFSGFTLNNTDSIIFRYQV